MTKNILDTRNRLPHIHSYGLIQFITFRLFDSIPLSKLREILALSESDLDEGALQNSNEAIEDYFDQGLGHAWLRHPQISKCVQDAIFHFDGERYDLHAWVIMPNHVHVLICPYDGEPVGKIVQDLKSFSARTANSLLHRKGQFWARNYFDRYMRDEAHYCKTMDYIEDNPVKAGLCAFPPEWPWSSAAYPRR